MPGLPPGGGAHAVGTRFGTLPGFVPHRPSPLGEARHPGQYPRGGEFPSEVTLTPKRGNYFHLAKPAPRGDQSGYARTVKAPPAASAAAAAADTNRQMAAASAAAAYTNSETAATAAAAAADTDTQVSAAAAASELVPQGAAGRTGRQCPTTVDLRKVKVGAICRGYTYYL